MVLVNGQVGSTGWRFALVYCQVGKALPVRRYIKNPAIYTGIHIHTTCYIVG